MRGGRSAAHPRLKEMARDQLGTVVEEIITFEYFAMRKDRIWGGVLSGSGAWTTKRRTHFLKRPAGKDGMGNVHTTVVQ